MNAGRIAAACLLSHALDTRIAKARKTRDDGGKSAMRCGMCGTAIGIGHAYFLCTDAGWMQSRPYPSYDKTVLAATELEFCLTCTENGIEPAVRGGWHIRGRVNRRIPYERKDGRRAAV
jgi:hypothetical protein